MACNLPCTTRTNGIMTWGLRAILQAATVILPALILFQPAAATTYEQIRVPYPDPERRQDLFFHSDVELLKDDDGGLILLSRPHLTAELRSRGFRVDVLIPDLEAHYVSRMSRERDYGVWHTYAEMIVEMNAIHAEFPHLTTAPASIGETHEGRHLWAMKVAINPYQQTDKPEVLIDGTHHAREIMALEIPLHFIRYLCENHETDPVIRFIVENRQVWFVPMVNPDGFVYNQTTNPNGGGMWRKNRRNNEGSSCYGVDLNRNYPFEWVGPGSSTNPCNDTYRGPWAGSEPEVAALVDFINAREFVTWQTYHSYGNWMLYPWGYTTNATPDAALFHAMAVEMTLENGYVPGQISHLLYGVNGGSIDWGYGATQERPKIFTFCAEVGSAFWPAQNETESLIAENIWSNIYLCLVAGAYVELLDLAAAGGGTRLDPGETASLVAMVKNSGLLTAVQGVTLTLSCDDPYISLIDATGVIGNMAPGAVAGNAADPFELSVSPECPQGRPVSFTVRITADCGFDLETTVAFTVGQLPVVYSCDFESPSHGWAQDPSHNALTGAFVRINPVATNWQPGEDTSPDGQYAWVTAQNPNGNEGIDDVDEGIAATRSPVMDLSGVGSALLVMDYFFGQRDHGDDPADFFSIDISNNGGASFPVNLVHIGDVRHYATWRSLQVNLEEHIALTSQMVIRVQAADPGGYGYGDIVEAGLDEIYIFDRGEGNEPPSAPVQVSPPDGAGVPPAPGLVVANALDPEGDPLTYGFQVFADAALTQLVASVAGLPEGGGGTTSWTVSPGLPNGTYYWRAFAADPHSCGLCSAAGWFDVTAGAGVDPGGDTIAVRLTTGPNPASGDVLIRYYTPHTHEARLDIFDAAGRRVRSIPAAAWAEGWQEVVWDGRDHAGAQVSAGVYWVRLQLPLETRTARVVRVH